MMRASIFILALGNLAGCAIFNPFPVDAPPGPDAVPGTAVLTLSMDPNPLQEALCEGCGADQLAAAGTLTITETNGVAVNITQIDVSQSSDNGLQATGSYFSAAIEATAGTDEVTADGSLAIPGVGVHYDEELGFVSAVSTITVQAQDANGHDVAATISVQVVPD